MSASISRSEWMRVFILTALILLLANSLYLLAYAAPAPHVFSGFLFNPVDGNSYLAKMREGYRGEWAFTLPYTAEPGDGVFIFTYYLFLGHLARWLGLGIPLVYHFARGVAGLALLLSAYHFIARFFETSRARLGIWLLFALGSGLGWLYFILRLLAPFLPPPLEKVPVDMWVAEFIPFLSIFANSHFCFTAALMLWVFEWTLPGLAAGSPSQLFLTALAVTLMAQTQPLGLFTVGLVLGGLSGWQIISHRAVHWPNLVPVAVVGLFAVPWLGYDFWMTATHPILREWNAQNLTPSPALWELLISGGLPLLLALFGITVAGRRRVPRDLIPLFWFGLTLLALYSPFSLQRRLTLGLWMPIVILAGQGISALWPRLAPRLRPLVGAVFILGTVLSNAIILLSVFGGIQQRDLTIYFTADEAATWNWLADHSAERPLVAAAPETGLFIPAHSDARVIYGHPFETMNATAQKQALEDFYAGRLAPPAFLAAYPVDLIFYGPREAKLGALPSLAGWRVVFQQGATTLYARPTPTP